MFQTPFLAHSTPIMQIQTCPIYKIISYISLSNRCRRFCGNLFLLQNAQNIHKGEHIYCDVDNKITHINCDVDKTGLICLNWSITIMIGSGVSSNKSLVLHPVSQLSSS